MKKFILGTLLLTCCAHGAKPAKLVAPQFAFLERYDCIIEVSMGPDNTYTILDIDPQQYECEGYTIGETRTLRDNENVYPTLNALFE